MCNRCVTGTHLKYHALIGRAGLLTLFYLIPRFHWSSNVAGAHQNFDVFSFLFFYRNCTSAKLEQWFSTSSQNLVIDVWVQRV